MSANAVGIVDDRSLVVALICTALGVSVVCLLVLLRCLCLRHNAAFSNSHKSVVELVPVRTDGSTVVVQCQQLKPHRSHRRPRPAPQRPAAEKCGTVPSIPWDEDLNDYRRHCDLEHPEPLQSGDVTAAWALLSVLGGNNSLSSTAPTTPDPPENFAGDSLVRDLLYGYGGSGRGSRNDILRVRVLAADKNPVTRAKWRFGEFHGPGETGQYTSQANAAAYSGDTGFDQPGYATGNIDTSSPRVLQAFLSRAKTITAKAAKTMFVAWGHSYSWAPDACLENEDDNGLVGYCPIDVDPYYTGRATTSLSTALTAVGGVDVFVFNSCMGQGVENMYTLRNCVKVLVGNADYTGWSGLNCAAIVDVLSHGGASLDERAAAAACVKNYAPQLDGTLNFAISAYPIAQCGAPIRAAVCELAGALVRALDIPSLRGQIVQARMSISWADYDTGVGGNGGIDALFLDAARFALQLLEFVVDDQNTGVRATAHALYDILMKSDIARHATGSFAGLAAANIFLPDSVSSWTTSKSGTPDGTLYKDIYRTQRFNSDAMPSPTAASWYAFLDKLYS